LVDADGVAVDVPDALVDVWEQVIDQLRAGNGVTVVPRYMPSRTDADERRDASVIAVDPATRAATTPRPGRSIIVLLVCGG
jgi:hypothetical protein